MFALVFNGLVVEIAATEFPVAPPMEWIGIPAGQPVSTGYTWSGSAFSAPVVPSLSLAEQAAAMIAAGITITSTSTPALNGTYAVASGVPFGREDIGSEAQFVTTFSEFTNGTTTLEWPLLDGSFVTFPTTAAFMAFAKAAAQFYAAAKGVAALGSGTLPAASVTIA